MRLLSAILFMIILVSSCKKDEKENPYDLVNNNNQNTEQPDPEPDPNSIQGLHRNIFAPTCANSGCHDGTFEPDFRTIESSYNTLVLQPVIKNNPSGTYNFRVAPGNADESVLIARLVSDIDGQSGIMPLAVDPGSDWEQKRAQYLENIRTWINSGAKDVFGNTPQQSSLPPQLQGMFITLPGSTEALPRNVQSGSVVIPPGTATVDVYFACSDDQFSAEEIGYLQFAVSSSINNFDPGSQMSLSLVPEIMHQGYSGNQVSFRFMASIGIGSLTQLQSYFLRVYLSDESSAVTEIPSASSAEYIKRYYSFQIGE